MYGNTAGTGGYAARQKAFTGGSTVSNYKCFTGFRTIRTGMRDGETAPKCPPNQIPTVYGRWGIRLLPRRRDGVRMLLSECCGPTLFSLGSREFILGCRAHWKSSTGAMTLQVEYVVAPRASERRPDAQND